MSSIAEPIKILIVEDDAICVQVYTTMLKLIGHSSDVAVDGKHAFELLRNPYDLFILDISLPDMSGFDIAAEIRHRETGKTRAIIIAMTAAFVEAAEKQKGILIDDFWVKPVRFADIENIIQTLLESRVTGHTGIVTGNCLPNKQSL